MKISVLGAGAMGCLFGARLSEKNEVELINGREESVAAINKNGITVSDREGNIIHASLRSRLSGTDCEPADLVILFVKNYSTEEALEQNINLFGEKTVLLSLQNGMGHETIAQKFLPKERILIGVTNDNSISVSSAEVLHSGKGPTFIGTPGGNEMLAKQIVSVFVDSGFECSFSPDVHNLQWSKLFVNLAANATTAILGCRSGIISESEHMNQVCKALISEAVAVAKADGECFDENVILDKLTKMSHAYSQGRTSMCQDIEKHRKTEIDYINGAVSSLGKKYSVPTPVNDAVINLVHAKEYMLGIRL